RRRAERRPGHVGRRHDQVIMEAPAPAPYQEMLRRRGRDVASMPAHDPVIPAMDPVLRRAVGETWRRRAHEELKAAMAFTLLSPRRVGGGGRGAGGVGGAGGGATAGARHSGVCRAPAARYLDEEVPWPGPVHVEVNDEHGDRVVSAALRAVTLGCVNETVAA